MSELLLRPASVDDIPFLVETIIEAEQSGSDILTYSTIFGLSTSETKKYIGQMLAEEVDGCELSISSFLLATKKGKQIAAVAAWVEGFTGIPSSVIKGNLLISSLPRAAILNSLRSSSIIHDLHIANIENTIQIGSVYVSESFRGKNLVDILINQKIACLQQLNTNPDAAYVQVYGNNIIAIKAYEKIGFKIVAKKISKNTKATVFVPSDTKILMKRKLL